MMNIFSLTPTNLTASFSVPSGLSSCGLPSTTASITSASRPSGMIFTPVIFGLPFSHTDIITKDVFGMKVRFSPFNVLSTKGTLFCDSVRTARIFPSVLSYLSTFKRAINLISFACAGRWFSTNRAMVFRGFIAPSLFQVTGFRTIGLIGPSILRMKIRPTNSARFCFGKFLHIPMISTIAKMSIEIEEKYCEIAVQRLAQEVLPL